MTILNSSTAPAANMPVIAVNNMEAERITTSISPITTASGLVALLNDPNQTIASQAVTMLLQLVDYYWYELDGSTKRLLELAHGLANPHPAWLLLSKLHFHLGNMRAAVECALKAGPLFGLTDPSLYVSTVVAEAIDMYVALRNQSPPPQNDYLTTALEKLVEKLVTQCLAQGEFKQVIGIAIDTHRLDILEAALTRCPSTQLFPSLRYTREAVMRCGGQLDYKMQVLQVIVRLGSAASRPDYIFVADCWVAMQKADECAKLLIQLIERCSISSKEVASGESTLLRPVILQICFNICTDAPQSFLAVVNTALEAVSDSVDAEFINRIKAALNPNQSALLRLEFLYRNNHADPQIMERIKENLSRASSMHHSVLTITNALMHCGTTHDEFLRKNMDWLGHATNWAKFTAASSLGVLHKGQGREAAREILKPYLPTHDGTGSPYAEGGAMFALGLINAREEQAEKSYFLEELGKTDNEALIHGICLGMGALGMGSGDDQLIEAAKTVLYQDNAVTGEASALAIGLILLGSGRRELAMELLAYAHETQHEKTIRAIGLAIALIYCGLGHDANEMISTLLEVEKDTLLRYGGAWLVGTAYAGSSDGAALRRLLHAAVSDASDDVRRAAVTGLGLILSQNASELPPMVELLTESFNPHVRYGAAMALGLAFAGTGATEATTLLKPLCFDFTDFVRQAAFLALAMVMMQQNEVTAPDAPWVRNQLDLVTGTRHEDAMAKFGSILGQGIIDAGGRNCVIRLTTSGGTLINDGAVAGLVLFCQFWYWYPLAHFLSLALQPTALIAVDEELRIPCFEVECLTRPSRFALPPPLKTKVIATPKKLITAVLSTAARTAAKAKKGHKAMDIDVVGAGTGTGTGAGAGTAIGSVATERGEEVEEKGKEEDLGDENNKGNGGEISPITEPTAFKVSNLSRVIPQQLSQVRFPSDSKYLPVIMAKDSPLRAAWKGEILVMIDQQPDMLGEYFTPSEIKTTNISNSSSSEDKEKANEGVDDQAKKNKRDKESITAKPPKPFKYVDPESKDDQTQQQQQ